MKVRELIEALSKYDGDMEVAINDGVALHFYEGDFEVGLLEDLEEGESPKVEIAVGGNEMTGYGHSRTK